MKITTNSGKTFDINWIGATNRFGSKLMIELKDDRAFSEIAADFDGVDVFTKEDEKYPGVTMTYEGYSALVSMTRENADGVVRITLERGDA